MTDEREIHNIDLAVKVINSKLVRLERDKRQLLERRDEIVRKRHRDS